VLPVSDAFEPVEADAPYLTESLAKLGYPGLAYVRTRLTRKNPAEVLLTALIRQLRESRGGSPSMVAFAVLAEGIYLVIGPSEKTQSPESFGFVVSLARQVSERDPQNDHRTECFANSKQNSTKAAWPKKLFFTGHSDARKESTQSSKPAWNGRSADREHLSMSDDPIIQTDSDVSPDLTSRPHCFGVCSCVFLLASEWPVKKSFFGQAAFVEFCFEFAKHSGSVIVLRISL